MPAMNDAVRQSDLLPVGVVVADTTGPLTTPCRDAGITAHRALLVAATDDVDAFFAAVARFGVTVPSRRRDDLPAGVVQAVFEPIVGTARERAGRLLARCGDGRDGAILVDGEPVVPWADLGDLSALAVDQASLRAA
ncbi:hypothetical protein E143388_07809 [Rhodococcus opacus]|nr:hypothetical protein E143388_07809 [Rhodococcus opacus]